MDKSDYLSVMVYCFMKCHKIDDLYSQFKLITQFSSGFVQDGFGRLSQFFVDLTIVISFINSLNLNKLKAQGAKYL
jgi:hypothetical protein